MSLKELGNCGKESGKTSDGHTVSEKGLTLSIHHKLVGPSHYRPSYTLSFFPQKKKTVGFFIDDKMLGARKVKLLVQGSHSTSNSTPKYYF